MQFNFELNFNASSLPAFIGQLIILFIFEYKPPNI